MACVCTTILKRAEWKDSLLKAYRLRHALEKSKRVQTCSRGIAVLANIQKYYTAQRLFIQLICKYAFVAPKLIIFMFNIVAACSFSL